MKVLYFSWIKDKLGKSHEEIQVDDSISTINDLIKLVNSVASLMLLPSKNAGALVASVNDALCLIN